ncbi:MAG: hybrid sensor histidine kinase/response regulator, partial [Myxococcales bacterium]|nr:hybrid sensor histidine kinase/response regulator [Myxococcales bacterium]
CFVDRSQLENVILNLVVNARDAMPEGGAVTIETRNRRVADDEARALHLAPGDYVELSVTDTGIGMPEDVRARALDPFFTTKEVGKGSGLGLAMAHGMARQSGGHLELHSEVGVGTRVRLVLPRAEDGARKSSAPLVEVS